MRGRAEESRGPGGTVKQEIPSERCGEAARSVGRCRRGAPTSEGRSRKGRMGKDGGRGRESSEGRAAFIPSTRDTAAQPAHYKPRTDARTGQTLVPVIRSNYRERARSLIPELDSRRMQVLDLCMAQGAFYSVLLTVCRCGRGCN